MEKLKKYENIDFDDISEEEFEFESNINLLSILKKYNSGYYIKKIYTDINFELFYEGLDNTDLLFYYTYSSNPGFRTYKYIYLSFYWDEKTIKQISWMYPYYSDVNGDNKHGYEYYSYKYIYLG